MKFLSDYTKEPISALLKRTGAFFAFSKEQFLEASTLAPSEYVAMGAGLYCPRDQAEGFAKDLDAIGREGRAQDLAENGMDAVIERELANHECYYTGDLDDAFGALEGYEGITEREVGRVFAETIEKH